MVHSLDWIKRKKERSVLKHALDHLQKVKETVEALFIAFQNIDNRDQHIHQLHVVAQKEHEADVARRELTMEIAKDNLIFVGYEDLLGFVYEADSIADWAHTADRYLALFEGKLTPEIQKRITHLCELGVQSVRKLYEITSKLGEWPRDKVIEACHEIEALEENADDEKRELLRAIFKSDYTAAELIILRDLTEAVEDICDRCEISADRIRILAVQI